MSTKIYAYSKQIFILVLILAALFTRFWNLSEIPAALSHDEFAYVTNAQVLAVSGTNTTADWQPLSFSPVHPDFAELPTVLMAPFFWLPVSGIVASKLPFVILSLLVPVALYFLTKKITKSESAALAMLVISMFNPWFWQFSRLAFDPYFSFSFLIFGTLALVGFKKMWRWLSIPLFIIAFYQYQGHKLIFLPWVFWWASFGWYQQLLKSKVTVGLNKKTFEKFGSIVQKDIFPLVIMGFATLLFGYYLLVQLPGQASSDRLNSIVLPSSDFIQTTKLELRRMSLDSPLTKLAINDYTVWGGHILSRYMSVFSPRYLFFEGQANNSSFSVWNHGWFYAIDFFILAYGFWALAKHKKYGLLVLVIGGLVWAPIPALLAESDWFIFRPALILPFLWLVMAFGWSDLIKSVPKIIWMTAVGLYILGILRFGYIYFNRYPLMSAERNYYTEKVVASYFKRLPSTRKVLAATKEPEFLYKSSLFYNQWLTKQNVQQLQTAFKTEEFSWQNIKFSSDCFNPDWIEDTTTTFVVRTDQPFCTLARPVNFSELPVITKNKLAAHLSFSAIKDSGEVYMIFNDLLCQGIELGSYPRITKLNQLSPAKLNDADFCKTWVMDLSNL